MGTHLVCNQKLRVRFSHSPPKVLPRWWNRQTHQFQKLAPTRHRSSTLFRGTKLWKNGRVRFIATVLKTVECKKLRGFESYFFRQVLVGVMVAQGTPNALAGVRFSHGMPVIVKLNGKLAEWQGNGLLIRHSEMGALVRSQYFPPSEQIGRAHV